MKKQWYLLSYDIRHVKRLQKFHYRLKKRAFALQKSVFLLEADATDVQQIISLVEQYTHTLEDDVRLYPISHPKAIWSAGIQHQVFANKGWGDGEASKVKAKGFMRTLKKLLVK